MTAADILITNARILTMDGARPRAEALAITGNRITRVGSRDDVAGLKAKHTRVIDAQMKTVMPGIIEGHVHLFGGSVELDTLMLNGIMGFDAIVGISFSIPQDAPQGRRSAGHGHHPRGLRRAHHPAAAGPHRRRHPLHRRLLRPSHHVGQYQGAGGSRHHARPRPAGGQRDRARRQWHRHRRTARARRLHAGAGADPHRRARMAGHDDRREPQPAGDRSPARHRHRLLQAGHRLCRLARHHLHAQHGRQLVSAGTAAGDAGSRRAQRAGGDPLPPEELLRAVARRRGGRHARERTTATCCTATA